MSKEFFNQKAEEWDQMVDHNPEKIRLVLQGLPDLMEPKVLDVGSGTGVLIPFLKERFGEETKITAIDFAEKMLEVSRRKHQQYTGLEFIVGDVNTYIFSEGIFDLVICYSVFPHFADQQMVLERLQGCLKVGGRLLIFHSQSREAINNLHQKAGEEVREDRLPAAEVVAVMGRELGYRVERLVENGEMYVVEFLWE